MITKNPASQTLIVKPTGELEALMAEHYRNSLKPLLEDGYRYVIFDLELTRFVTSAGLGLLVEIHNRVMGQQGSLRLINCHERIRQLLEQSRLDQIFEFTEGEGARIIPFDSLHGMMKNEILVCSRFNELTEKALKSSDPEQIAKLVLEGMATACDARMGAFLRHVEAEGRFEVQVTRGLDSAEVFAEGVPVEPARFISGDSAEDIILVEREAETVKEDALLDFFTSMGAMRGVMVAIRGDDELLGLVVLGFTSDEGTPLVAIAPVVRTFSTICGLALSKCRLLGQLEIQNVNLQETLMSVQKFQDTLVDVGKLAALGAVLSGLGHLLNNKLVPIIGYTEMLTQAGDLPEGARKRLNVVNGAAVDLKNVMEKLIRVGRVREIAYEPVNINEVVTAGVVLLGYHVEDRGVALQLSLDDSIPEAPADRDLLLQAILAVLHRATISFADGQDDRWILIESRSDGENVQLRFEDNGAGLAEMSEQDWLDPLAPYTGLVPGKLFNYSIPRSVMKRHRGTISLTEKPDGGTIVEMTLPTGAKNGPVAGRSPEQIEQNIA